MLHKALLNPYCRGAVTFKGAEERPGVHRPLVDEAFWQQVQAVLDARRRGQRERPHRHCPNPPLAQLNALVRPRTPSKAQTQPTKNPPQQAKNNQETAPPPPTHTTNEPWSLHDQGSHKTIVAVAAGFEPAVAINHTAFRVLHLRPLGHATADYRSGITPRSATRQPVGRDTSPDCTSIVEPMPGSARPKRAPSRRAAYSPHAADVAKRLGRQQHPPSRDKYFIV